jgi:hypothetical protein
MKRYYTLRVLLECVEVDDQGRKTTTVTEKRRLPSACPEYPTLQTAQDGLDAILEYLKPKPRSGVR